MFSKRLYSGVPTILLLRVNFCQIWKTIRGKYCRNHSNIYNNGVVAVCMYVCFAVSHIKTTHTIGKVIFAKNVQYYNKIICIFLFWYFTPVQDGVS